MILHKCGVWSFPDDTEVTLRSTYPCQDTLLFERAFH